MEPMSQPPGYGNTTRRRCKLFMEEEIAASDVARCSAGQGFNREKNVGRDGR